MDIEVRLDLRVEAVMGVLALARPRLPGSGWWDHPIRREARRRWSGLSGHAAPRLLRRMLGRTFWVDDLCRLAGALLVVRSARLCLRSPMLPQNTPVAIACCQFARALEDFAERARLTDVLEQGAEIPLQVTGAVGGTGAIEAWVNYIRSNLGPGPGRIRIFPSPLSNGRLGYGPTSITPEGAEAWVIFGPVWRADWTRCKLCGFDSPKLGRLIRHELGHSSLNQYTAGVPDLAKFEHLFAPMRRAMHELGYDRWDICLNELILRAVEIRWIALEEGEAAAQRLRNRELRKGFILIHDAERALEEVSGAPICRALPDFLNALAQSARRMAA